MVFHYWNLLAWSSQDEPETSESETTALVTSDLVTPDSCASLRRPDSPVHMFDLARLQR